MGGANMELTTRGTKRQRTYNGFVVRSESDVSAILESGEKKCTSCRCVKPLEQFSRSKYHSTGRAAACKQCSAVRFQEWKNNNLEKARRIYRISHYVTTYGISKEEATRLTKDRHGSCAICGLHRRLVIDHHHGTNKVREKICAQCNTLIGCARESIDVLKSVIAYLEKHSG